MICTYKMLSIKIDIRRGFKGTLHFNINLGSKVKFDTMTFIKGIIGWGRRQRSIKVQVILAT